MGFVGGFDGRLFREPVTGGQNLYTTATKGVGTVSIPGLSVAAG